LFTNCVLIIINNHNSVEQLLVGHRASEPEDFYGFQTLFS
jgi:hypothetical protein